MLKTNKMINIFIQQLSVLSVINVKHISRRTKFIWQN